jgi:hypothetical protein
MFPSIQGGKSEGKGKEGQVIYFIEIHEHSDVLTHRNTGQL